MATAPAKVAFDPQPIDWNAADPTIDVLFPPYLYVGMRTWVWGRTESGKSMWVQYVCAQLSRQGKRIVYLQQENPEAVERGRWRRLKADLTHCDVYHDQSFDLTDQAHIDRLVRIARGADLVVIDSLTSCWTGDENVNQEIAAFDMNVMVRLRNDVGCAIIVIHHTGKPGFGQAREAAMAGRGASSQGQKADTILEFRVEHRFPEGTFSIRHGKNRPGAGKKEPPTRYSIVDLPDGSLDIVVDTQPIAGHDTKRQEVATKKMVAYLLKHPAGARHGEIVKATGITNNMFYKVVERLTETKMLRERETRNAPYALSKEGRKSARGQSK